MLGGLAVVVAVVGAGCSQTQGGPQGFVSGGGTVTVIEAGEREPAPELTGETLDGERLSLADFGGQVVVLNVWGSWCAPCRAEAPDLVKAANRLEARGVQFLGIDVQDGDKANATAFVRNFDVPYPSIYDPDGSTLLGFRDTLPPNAIPSTLVIDGDGRVAARVLGSVTETTVVDLVDEASGGPS
ncbi:MAG: redoxin domain-containing protein [Propionibacteriales bacterium]|nr:redoxin domain-containing protein [Propionibacteriales bacterium]